MTALRFLKAVVFDWAGTVIDQSVKPGTRVPPASTIDLVVAASGNIVKVPDLVGDDREKAVRKLREKNLQPGRVTARPSCEDAGEIVAQNPPEDARVSEGTAVDLVVASTGSGIPVPKLTDLQQADAERLLRERGLAVKRVRREETDRRPPGTVIGQQPKPDRRPLSREQLRQFGRDPLAGEVANEVRARLDAGKRRGLDREPERCREANRPYHPERVLLKSFLWLADRAECQRGDVSPAAVRIDECGLRASGSTPGERVDREVTPGEVDLHRVTELDAMWPPVVRVVVVGAERRHFVQLPAVAHDHGPERVLVHGLREHAKHLVGTRIGGQVPVERGPAKQGVAQ